MILFFCGAPKNASHFQMFIVQEALSQKGIAFSNPGNDIFHNHELEAGKKLLEHLDGLSEEMFLCKGHWGSQVERDILLSYENIRIFLIWRDVRDALVSQYFYDINKFGKSYRDFSRFYWWTGRLFLLQQISYRHVWTVTQDPRIQNSSFVELKQNFVEAASKLLAFANIQSVDLEDLDRRLALDHLRKKHNDPNGAFFRKGMVGEHREVIHSKKIYDDISMIEKLDYDRVRRLIRFEKSRCALHSIKELPSILRKEGLSTFISKLSRFLFR